MLKGEVYQHYKMNNYTYLGITTPPIEYQIDWDLVTTIKATNEATMEEIEVYHADDNSGRNIYFCELEVQHVLYESHKDGKLWLRNARDFFGPVTPHSILRFTSLGV